MGIYSFRPGLSVGNSRFVLVNWGWIYCAWSTPDAARHAFPQGLKPLENAAAIVLQARSLHALASVIPEDLQYDGIFRDKVRLVR
jgi:hypothetical protein